MRDNFELSKGLSVVVPVYNEEANIKDTLTELRDYFGGSQEKADYEVIVVDDASNDLSPGILAQAAGEWPQMRVITHAKRTGKGWAVRDGIIEARYSMCLFIDADLSTGIREWDRFRDQFESGAKAVIASRHLPGSQIETPQPFARRFLGSGYRMICRFLFGITVSDFNCGFKAYRTDIAKRVFARLQMSDWTFDVEILIYLRKLGISVVEVPVRWRHQDKKTGIRPFQTALKSIRSLARLYFKVHCRD